MNTPLRYVAADVHPYGPDSLVTAPTGATFHVRAEPAQVDAALRALDGRRDLAEVLSAHGLGEAFAEVVAVLAEDGVLTPVAPRTGLHLLADQALADGLRAVGLPDGARLHPVSGATTAPEELAPLLDRLDLAEDEVVVALRTAFAPGWLLALDRWADMRGRRWTQLHLTAAGAVWGPHVEPGRTASYHDTLQRRRCAVDEPEVADALMSDVVAPAALPSPADLAWILGGFLADLTRWAGDKDCRGLSCEVEARTTSLSLEAHPVLPLPSHPLTGPLRISGQGTDLLISERTGIIQRIRPITHHPEVPARLRTVQTHCSSMARVDPEWANDVITGGSSFDDADAARASAIGEAVERYCGNHMGQAEVRWASHEQLVAEGEHAVDPEQLVLYSEQMLAMPGCPFEPFTRDLQVRWVRGRSLTHDRPTWLPVTLVFVNWLAAEGGTHPLTNYMNFSGVAAGSTLAQALVSGIEELVERDATMVWWHNAHPLPAVRPTPALTALTAGSPDDAGQRAWLIHLDNQFDIPVMAGLVHHTGEDFFTIGFAARPDPEEAGRKAWTEAWTLQEGSRDLDQPDSLIRKAIDWGFASYVDLKPHRADRRYLDDYRPDFLDVSDLMCQQQVFLDPRAIDAVRHFTHVPATREMADLPRLPDRSLQTYRDRIEPQGFEICYVDCTTPDVAAAGMHAVRVVIPGLVGNAPAAFPLLGRGRVQQVPVDLGWRTEPLAEAALNRWPIPHA